MGFYDCKQSKKGVVLPFTSTLGNFFTCSRIIFARLGAFILINLIYIRFFYLQHEEHHVRSIVFQQKCGFEGRVFRD